MKKLAIFASGSGSNAEVIIRHFSTTKAADVVLLLTNRSDAPVIERANKLQVEVVIFDRDELNSENGVLQLLRNKEVDLIILAGFLWLLPPMLIGAYRGRIINIHPALLPAYGGKGMYGEKVHRAVIGNHEKVSGITIHYVDEIYDNGDIIFQASLKIADGETADSLAARIHALEHKYFPLVIEEIVSGRDPGSLSEATV